MKEMQRCLSQLNEQMDCFNYQWEARLHQLLFEAFMLAEETFKKTSCNYNVRAMTLCRHLHKPTSGHVYAHFLVSWRQDNSWLHCFRSSAHNVCLWGAFTLQQWYFASSLLVPGAISNIHRDSFYMPGGCNVHAWWNMWQQGHIYQQSLCLGLDFTFQIWVVTRFFCNAYSMPANTEPQRITVFCRRC